MKSVITIPIILSSLTAFTEAQIKFLKEDGIGPYDPKSSYFSPSEENLEYCVIEKCILDPDKGGFPIDKKPRPGCVDFNYEEFKARNIPIFYQRAKGRLGNQLVAFSIITATALAWNNGTLNPTEAETEALFYIPRDMSKFMVAIFDPSCIPYTVWENQFCNWPDIPFKVFDGSFTQILSKHEGFKGQILKMFEGDKGYSAEMYGGPLVTKYKTKAIEWMRNNLKFRPKIKTRVKKTFEDVKRKYKKFHPDFSESNDQLVFVALHNRRTDYQYYMEKRYNEIALEMDYFIGALDTYRRLFKHVAFIYVSDDKKWGRHNFDNDLKDIFFVNDGRTEEPEALSFDMALMANCDHFIHSRGSFSMWGGILNGGLMYTEVGFSFDPLFVLDQWYPLIHKEVRTKAYKNGLVQMWPSVGYRYHELALKNGLPEEGDHVFDYISGSSENAPDGIRKPKKTDEL